MQKKYLAYLLALLVLGGTALMAYKTVHRLQTKKALAASLKTLPHFIATGLDSTQIRYPQAIDKPLIIMYFNTECEHCQYETQELKKHLAQFANAQILMLSNESLAKLKTFAKSYALTDIDNLQIAQIPANKAFEIFGFTSVPSLIIYSKNQQLVKQYKGETKMETVVGAANSYQ